MKKDAKGKAKANPHGTIQINGNTSGTDLVTVPLPSTPTGIHQLKEKGNEQKPIRPPTGATFTRLMDTPLSGALTTHTAQAVSHSPKIDLGATHATPTVILRKLAGVIIPNRLLKGKGNLQPPKAKGAKATLAIGNGRAKTSPQLIARSKPRLPCTTKVLRPSLQDGGTTMR